MPKFVIEREIPGLGNLSDAELREISGKSVKRAQRDGAGHSMAAQLCHGDKLYCVYIAPDEASIREHAKPGRLSCQSYFCVRR